MSSHPFRQVEPLEDPLDSSNTANAEPTELYYTYESKYTEIISQLKEVLRQLTNEVSPPSKREQERLSLEVDKLLARAQKQLRELDMEAQEFLQGKEKIRRHKQDLQICKSQFDKFKLFQANTAYDEEDDDEDNEYGNVKEAMARQKMRESEKLIQSSSASLKRSLVVVNETEELGHETVKELGRQREKIKSTIAKTQDVDRELNVTTKPILSRMEWRKMSTNICLILTIILLIVAILFILYFGYIRPLFVRRSDS